MKIKNIVLSKGRTGFFFDDQKAIKEGAKADGAAYIGEAVTPGFDRVRIPGESISIQVLLDDGQVAIGDCAAVQYSGAGGRDPLFLAETFIPIIEEHIFPVLIGKEITTFKEMAQEIEELKVDGKPLHTAIRYGVSQAILDTVAKANHKMPVEVVAEEYNLSVKEDEIPIFTQTGDDRYIKADTAILKKADVLPHALINNIEKLGEKGEVLFDYVKWLSNRITELSHGDGYNPTIHIDVYGTLGIIFGVDGFEEMASYLDTLAEAAKPYQLRIEGPMDAGNKEDQIRCLAALRKELDEKSIPVEIVADEWCNTLQDIKDFADAKAGHMIQIKTPDLGGIQNVVEAILYCKEKGVLAYQGGTCNETERSCQICVHVGMAAGCDQILAKPGMGVDEGFMIVYNEMQRILALRKAR